MGRPRKNALEIRSRGEGYELIGYINGERVRKRSANYGDLEAIKGSHEQKLAAPSERPQAIRLTWLTEAQLRDAEAAVSRAGGRSLLECVEASDRVMVTGEPVTLGTAWTEWEQHLRSRKRFERTIGNNKDRVAAFTRHLAGLGVKHTNEVTPEHVEAFIFRGERADFTRANDAAVVQAWCRFWIRRRWVKASPFEVDLRDLRERARPEELPRILTPTQARALMAAALARDGGALAPYVALSTWCFLRHAEALRVAAADLRLDGKAPVVEVRPRKRGTVSYRAVSVPACVLPILREARARALAAGRESAPVAPWGRVRWDAIRAAAGLATLGPLKNRKRAVESAVWQENILRHTGISYHYQAGGSITDTTRQAGNSSDTAFRHYLNLPKEGAADEFYGEF